MAIVTGCSTGPGPEETSARRYCGSCHAFPDPSLLPKKSWEQNVLPAMGRLMGLQFYNGVPYQDVYTNQESKNSLTVPVADWLKIVAYYKKMAPDQLPAQPGTLIHKNTSQFEVVTVPGHKAPATVFLKIDAGNQWIYTAETADSLFHIYDAQLNRIQSVAMGGTLIDLWFDNSLQNPGSRTGIFTNIGILHPNEGSTGSAQHFLISGAGTMSLENIILDSLPRPVQVQSTDLDKDGQRDFLVCGFGNQRGSFFWMRGTKDGFEKKMLRQQPGAVKAYSGDYNNDGLPDIMALFAQGNEGIFLYTNKGDGSFSETMLLQFPPVYGSSYFELKDMNADGRDDIIYTCGDNADYTADVLKGYHGIYIFLNKGNHQYRQAFFFPINGCYKAVAKDFDRDGDLDLAAISYFPDLQKKPQESFVYLQNKGALVFEPFSITGHDTGNWITMDAGDVDGDGDEDIVIGSLLPPEKNGGIKKEKHNPPFLLLRNRRQ